MNSAERRRQFRRNRLYCVYCGGRATGRDHVPPKCVFGDLVDSCQGMNLIVVPSCDACNGGETENDTYFRDAVWLMSQRPNDAAPHEEVRAAILRSVQKAGKNHQTPIQALMRNSRRAWTRDADTGLLVQGNAVNISWTRVTRVVKRIASGLYWVHRNERVPAGFEVSVIGDSERGRFTSVEQVELFGEMAIATTKGEKRHVHQAVFSYSIAFADDDPRHGAVLLVFHRRVIFLVLISPPNRGIELPSAPAIFLP